MLSPMHAPFHKAPKAMVAELAQCRWTPEHPAPTVVGYLFALDQLWEGVSLSTRALQRWAGWTKYKATKVLCEAREAMDPGKIGQASGKIGQHPSVITDTYDDESGKIGHPSGTSRARGDIDQDHRSRSEQGATPPWRLVYDHWRSQKPKRRKVPSPATIAKIKARLKHATVEECQRMVEWAHHAPNAKHYQGENDRNTAFLGIGTLFKAEKWDDRLDFALEWRPLAAEQPALSIADYLRANIEEAVRIYDAPPITYGFQRIRKWLEAAGYTDLATLGEDSKIIIQAAQNGSSHGNQ